MAACAHAPARLEGTSWQLAVPDGARYTLRFEADGVFTARIDCNRARGSWSSKGPGRLEFGDRMAMTRAECPPGSLHDQIVRQLPLVRSYVVRDGKLYLALAADGGTLEFTSSP